MSDLQLNQEARDASLMAARHVALPLPRRPRLAPWLRTFDLGDDRLQLRSAESAHTLTHPLLIQVFRAIATALDGTHTVAEMMSLVGPDVLPTTVVFLLKLLQGKGLLQPGAGESSLSEEAQARWAEQIGFFSRFVPDAPAAQSRLLAARVAVAGPGLSGAGPAGAGLAGAGDLRAAIASALASVGIGDVAALDGPSTWGTQAADLRCDLIIACAESPAFAFFDAVNSACLAGGARWLRASIEGTTARLGPTVVPHQTACNTCLDLRLRSHQHDLDGYLAYRDRDDGGRDDGGAAPLRAIIAGQVALEVMRLVTGFAPPATIGRFHAFGAGSPAAVAHDVLRVPRCPACARRRTTPEAWDRGLAALDAAP